MVKRILLENTRAFDPADDRIVPITGFSCWALGYLDPAVPQDGCSRYGLIGCLLHPARNDGLDLRYRVDYGDKCKRESCQEAAVFDKLGADAQRFWLGLSTGLDAFAYSSRTLNPLFRVLGWGDEVLNRIGNRERGKSLDTLWGSSRYPVMFDHDLNPRENAYLLTWLVQRRGVDLLKGEAFLRRFSAFSARMVSQLEAAAPWVPHAPRTHRLDMDQRFLDFLRLAVGIQQIDLQGAARLTGLAEEALCGFLKELDR
jgi:hypothetical protein